MSQHSISKFFSNVKKEKELSNDVILDCNNPHTNTNVNVDLKPKITKRKANNTEKSTKLTNSNKKLKSNLTEFEKQILLFKLNHLNKLLLIQNGYRYKFFGNDALIASKILNIKLTNGKLSYDLNNPSKNDYLYSTFASASIPIERLLIHVRRLINKGYIVGIVDQIETAAIRDGNGDFNEDDDTLTTKPTKSKIFERKLTNIYSPGTFINDDDLENSVNGKSIIFINESINNYISIVSVNVFTSNIVYDEFNDNFNRSKLELRLYHLEPIEIKTIGNNISSETINCIKNFQKFNSNTSHNNSNISYNHIQSSSLSSSKSFGDIILEFQENDLNNETISFLSNLQLPLIECFYEQFQYLKEFKLSSSFEFLENYKNFSDIDNNIILDSSVLKNLEIFNNLTTGSERGTLFEILNNTLTKFGQRVLKNWIYRPLINKNLIIERYDAIDFMIKKLNSLQVERVVNLLKNCPDLELIHSRIHYNKSNRREVYIFLKKIIDILKMFQNVNDQLFSQDIFNSDLLYNFYHDFKKFSVDEFDNINNLLDMIYSPAAMDLKSSNNITDYFNEKFFKYDEIQTSNDKIQNVYNELDEELLNIREITKNKGLKYLKINNEPYLIEIRKSNINIIPNDWTRISATANCIRFRSPQTIKLYKKLKYYEELHKQLCNRLFEEFINKIKTYHYQISKLINKLGMFDALFSLSIASSNNNYNKPTLVDIPIIKLKNSRNPISEYLLKQKTVSIFNQNSIKSSTYIENDFNLNTDNFNKINNKNNNNKIALITGPNMGGKSSFMRQVGLITIMSQIGSFIPCDKNSILGIFNNICIRIGSNDDIFQGKSTFQIELMECKKILDIVLNNDQNNKNSLILIDELGRGTSTTDGLSIAWSVLDYFINNFNNNIAVLFITHFKQLEKFENLTNGIVKNYFMGYKLINENDLMFTYKLTPGTSNGSYGIYCAKLSGLPEIIVNRSNEISNKMESKDILNELKKVKKLINTKEMYKLHNFTERL